MLGALDRVGVEQRALAVVPNERANGLIPTDGPLARLLRSEAARGSEILLHGWTHAAEGALRGAWPDRLRAHLFAPHDAEFLSIAPDEATRRLDAGCRALRDLGLPTSGFLAPAWLSPPGLPQSLRATGFRYLVGYTSVLLLASMRRIPAPSIGYFGAGAIQEWLAALGGWMARVVIRRAPILQVALHPAGAPASPRAAAMISALPALLERHRATTYRQLLVDDARS